MFFSAFRECFFQFLRCLISRCRHNNPLKDNVLGENIIQNICILCRYFGRCRNIKAKIKGQSVSPVFLVYFMFLYILYSLLYLEFFRVFLKQRRQVKCLNVYFYFKRLPSAESSPSFCCEGAVISDQTKLQKINNVEEHQSSNENA